MSGQLALQVLGCLAADVGNLFGFFGDFILFLGNGGTFLVYGFVLGLLLGLRPLGKNVLETFGNVGFRLLAGSQSFNCGSRRLGAGF